MFSVLMASYNGAKYIVEQLESILNQTVKVNRIYIFDDCSTDDTLEILSAYIIKHNIDNVCIKRNLKNKGYTRNFLEALFEIDDDYIFLCDQDDVWNENKIYEYKNFIDKNAESTLPLLLTSGYYVTDGELNIKRSVHCNKTKERILSLKSFLKNCSYPGMTFCINKTLKEKLSELYLSEKIAFHDYFISLVAIKFGRMICINKGLVLYRQHSNNQIGVSGKRNRSYNYWEKVLLQKQSEIEIADYVFTEHPFIELKRNFIIKRILNFQNKKLLSILMDLFNYLRFYDLKSYLADLYYSFFVER